MWIKRAIAVLTALAALILWVSVAHTRAPINDVYVIHFIVDGTNLKTFDKAIEEERLPTVRRLFYENGAVFTHGLSAFPTTSTSVYQAYSTGLFPGHAGIPHLERFDRQKERVIGYLTPSGFDMVNSDLINLRALTNPDVALLQPPTTIFELLSGWPTETIYSSFSRGATRRYPRVAPIAAIWSTYVSVEIEDVDVLAMKRVMKEYGRPLDAIPRYALVGLYSSDIEGHKHGPKSDEVKRVLAQFDIFLRDFLKLLEKRGIADKTYIILSADHGMHATGRLFKLRAALEERGIRLKSSKPYRTDYALYVANRGVASSHIYVRHEGGFTPITDPEILRRVPTEDGGTVDLIDLIANLPATDLIIVRAGERKARIFDRKGNRADVACYNLNGVDYYSYEFEGGDPLGYSKNKKLRKMLGGKPHSTFAWREATAGERYPDAVVNLSQIFHDGRAGDVYVTARGRYGFRKVKEGNHGGPTEDDMRTPFMIAGPTVPKGKFGATRPVDVYPLLLEWFGLDLPAASHDGRSPFAKYRGDDPSWQRLAATEKRIDEGERVRRNRSLAPLAEEEAARRKRLAERLGNLLEEMKSKRSKGKGNKTYADDHIAIVERALGWAQVSYERMVKIKKALK